PSAANRARSILLFSRDGVYDWMLKLSRSRWVMRHRLRRPHPASYAGWGYFLRDGGPGPPTQGEKGPLMREVTRPGLVRHKESPLPAVPVPWLGRHHLSERRGNGSSLVAAAARLLERLCMTLDQPGIDRRPAAIILTIAEVRLFADLGRR